MLLLLALACDDPAILDDCATLTPADCADAPTCAVLHGSPVAWADDGTCYDVGDPVPQGCQDAELSCPPSIAYGTPPDGDGACFEFAAGCFPEGWSACDPDPPSLGTCG